MGGFAFRSFGLSLLGAAALASLPAGAADFPQPLKEEPVPTVERLPERYPLSWMLVHDLHFNSILDGRATIVDVAASERHFKAQVPVAQFGNILAASSRPELYVAETFYSRLTRGERTDAITVWDKATLTPRGEIVLPEGKRGQMVTQKNAFQFTNGEQWGLVFNFTPASSVTVVDLVGRKVLGSVDIPGCAFIYPTGSRGFTTFCGDGTMTSIALDAVGKVAGTKTSTAFNRIDDDPLFPMNATVGRVAWFVSFRGNVRGIDMSGSEARDLGGFALPREAGGDPEWRPGGWQVITADPKGRLYILMNPKGREGSHKDGGTEVWVVDPAAKTRIARVKLRNQAVSIEATRQETPLLVASRADGALDVYDAATGTFQRTIGGSIVHDPMTMTALR